MTDARLDELIQKHILGIPSDAEMDELSQYLKRDDAAAARKRLRLALKADTYLDEMSAEILPIESSTESRPVQSDVIWKIGSIAAILFLGLFSWSLFSKSDSELQDTSIATVIRVDGTAVTNGNETISGGSKLSGGDQLTMESGLIEIVFKDTGVNAIATAPLSLTAQSVDRIFLHSGELKLHVPPQGVGFIVETAEREITDLGTSFVVSARKKGSQVFVLDGEIEVGNKQGAPGRLMTKGEMASFGEDGKFNLLSQEPPVLHERSQTAVPLAPDSLHGQIYAIGKTPEFKGNRALRDFISKPFAPLIHSGFREPRGLKTLVPGNKFRFTGIAGSYNQFPDRSGLKLYEKQAGWMAWYHGQVTPPERGRYRFWGYADNNLMVAIDGKPVFDGSRYDSGLRNIVKVRRENHPAWPCLNARAGFANGPWIEIGEQPVQLDILFGEIRGTPTSGILLVEHENASYEKTFWGQPKWPLLLTEPPTDKDLLELEKLRLQMEAKLMGSFSVSEQTIWKVHQPNHKPIQ